MRCEGGTFKNPEGVSLDLEGAQITGTLYFRHLVEKPAGWLDLRSARVGELADDVESWPNPGELILDGFIYDHLARSGPHTAKERLDWIGRQPATDFSLQPYEQLAKVLRGMGLEHDARRVAIAKQRVLRKLRRWWGKPWSLFLDVSIGYGYRPWLAVVWLLALWLMGVWFLEGVNAAGAMCATKSATYCATSPPDLSPGYPELLPPVFVIDTLLPFLDLHQEVYWEPNPTTSIGATLRVFQWVYIALGWLFSILAAIGFSGVLRKD